MGGLRGIQESGIFPGAHGFMNSFNFPQENFLGRNLASLVLVLHLNCIR